MKLAIIYTCVWSTFAMIASYTIGPQLVYMVTGSHKDVVIVNATNYLKFNTIFYYVPAVISSKKCYARNRGSDHTISIQWIRNGRKSGDRIYISSFDGICRCYRSRTDRMVYHGYSIARTDHKNTEIKSK